MALNAKEVLRSIEEIWEEARRFNAALNIPVKWKSAPKRSGHIKKKSWTDGISLNSPYHVLLLEDLPEMKRKKGEFFCRTRITNWKLHELFNLSDPERSKRIKVTCPRCLEAAKRLR